ncbi:iron-sulfur cluster assembly scaffold protein [Qipengyuania sp. MTN3-11]|uniref:iron-sulfur cluster assembly scaffold protein n=1 Tax=Qipengyuania sp. MTN3-11 TaxID=3056557 RepID=UPI0036F27480
MTAVRAAPLYTPQMLALAVELAEHPLADDMRSEAELRSRTCGSTLRLGLRIDEDRRVVGVGMRVSACAVGQAAAAIFAGDAHGRNHADIGETLDGLENWLAGQGMQPGWRRLEFLAPALAYSGRHEAILLPWRAALDALSNTGTPR